MASRSATILVIFVIAVLAFSFASVFAAMTGTYHINFNFGNNTNDTPFFGNVTEFNSDHSSSDSNVQTYTDSGSSDSSQSNVETKEDTNPTPTPAPTPSDGPSDGGNGTSN